MRANQKGVKHFRIEHWNDSYRDATISNYMIRVKRKSRDELLYRSSCRVQLFRIFIGEAREGDDGMCRWI